MQATEKTASSDFQWNAGAWFGTQIGCTAWMLTFAASLMMTEPVSATAGLCSFMILNAWGILLWSSRHTMTAYVGIQRFLMGTTVAMTALVCFVKDLKGISAPVNQVSSQITDLPYWIILLPPALMGMMYFRERQASRDIRPESAE